MVAKAKTVEINGKRCLELPEPTRVQRAYLAEQRKLIAEFGRIAAREWSALMLVYGDQWNEAVGASPGLVQDADTNFPFRTIISTWRARVGLAYKQLVADRPGIIVEAISKQLDLFSQNTTGAAFETVLGVKAVLPGKSEIVRQFTRENMDLIVAMPSRALDRLEPQLIDAAKAGRRHEHFSRVVKEELGVSDRRAKLIARDQIQKFNSRLNEERQTELGIEEYVWQTSGDDRVVGTPGGLYPEGNRVHGDHYSRDGQVFRWDTPPHDGPPGFAINCRCRALPVVEKALEKQDAELEALIKLGEVT